MATFWGRGEAPARPHSPRPQFLAQHFSASAALTLPPLWPLSVQGGSCESHLKFQGGFSRSAYQKVLPKSQPFGAKPKSLVHVAFRSETWYNSGCLCEHVSPHPSSHPAPGKGCRSLPAVLSAEYPHTHPQGIRRSPERQLVCEEVQHRGDAQQ